MLNERDSYFAKIGLPFEVFEAIAGKERDTSFPKFLPKRLMILNKLKKGLIGCINTLGELIAIHEGTVETYTTRLMLELDNKDFDVVAGAGVTSTFVGLKRALSTVLLEESIYEEIMARNRREKNTKQNSAYFIRSLLSAHNIKPLDFHGAMIWYYLKWDKEEPTEHVYRHDEKGGDPPQERFRRAFKDESRERGEGNLLE